MRSVSGKSYSVNAKRRNLAQLHSPCRSSLMEVLLLHPLQAERLSYLVQILHCMTRLLPSGILDRLCTRRWRPEHLRNHGQGSHLRGCILRRHDCVTIPSRIESIGEVQLVGSWPCQAMIHWLYKRGRIGHVSGTPTWHTAAAYALIA